MEAREEGREREMREAGALVEGWGRERWRAVRAPMWGECVREGVRDLDHRVRRWTREMYSLLQAVGASRRPSERPEERIP